MSKIVKGICLFYAVFSIDVMGRVDFFSTEYFICLGMAVLWIVSFINIQTITPERRLEIKRAWRTILKRIYLNVGDTVYISSMRTSGRIIELRETGAVILTKDRKQVFKLYDNIEKYGENRDAERNN